MQKYFIPLAVFEDKTITLREGFIWAVMKKPKKTIVGIYSTQDKAEEAIRELNGHKYFRKQKFILDTDIDKKKVSPQEDIMTQKLIIDKSVYNTPVEESVM